MIRKGLTRLILALSLVSGLLISPLIAAVQAEQLLVYSIYQPERFLQSQAQNWPVFYSPPQRADQIQLSNRGKVIYELNQGKDWDWYELDPQTGANRLIAKSGWFKSGFLSVLPNQRSDGAYYAKVILPYGVQIHLVSPTGPRPFLNTPRLYDFTPLSDGSYAYVIWNGHGNESNAFMDFIPGQQMQLWHKPLKGPAKLLGRFDTVHDLQELKQNLLFFTPGNQPANPTWKLMAFSTISHQARLITEIPKSKSRGTPNLVSWPQSDWIAYDAAMPDDDHAEREIIRHQVSSGSRHSLGQQWPFMLKKGPGQAGYLSSIKYGPNGSASHELLTYQLSSGNVIQSQSYRWKEVAPDRVIYLK